MPAAAQGSNPHGTTPSSTRDPFRLQQHAYWASLQDCCVAVNRWVAGRARVCLLAPLRTSTLPKSAKETMASEPVPPKTGEEIRKTVTSGEPDPDPGGYLGLAEPFSIDWCFSVIGAEYCHTYFWILKDLAWTQGWRLFSISIGSFAIMWWVILLYHSLRLRNLDEIWNCVGLFLWLFANFWWMTGEAHDYAYPDSPSIADRHNEESAHMLETAAIWLTVYYCFVVPCWGQITKDPKAIEEYDDGEFTPRFSYFRNFRQYENIHTLFWICKDLAWNRNNISMWFVFLWPTVGIASDLLYVSLNGKVRACACLVCLDVFFAHPCSPPPLITGHDDRRRALCRRFAVGSRQRCVGIGRVFHRRRRGLPAVGL